MAHSPLLHLLLAPICCWMGLLPALVATPGLPRASHLCALSDPAAGLQPFYRVSELCLGSRRHPLLQQDQLGWLLHLVGQRGSAETRCRDQPKLVHQDRFEEVP